MLKNIVLSIGVCTIISIFGCSNEHQPTRSVKDAKKYCKCLNDAGTDEQKMKECQELLMQQAEKYLENATKEEIKQYSQSLSDCI